MQIHIFKNIIWKIIKLYAILHFLIFYRYIKLRGLVIIIRGITQEGETVEK